MDRAQAAMAGSVQALERRICGDHLGRRQDVPPVRGMVWSKPPQVCVSVGVGVGVGGWVGWGSGMTVS